MIISSFSHALEKKDSITEKSLSQLLKLSQDIGLKLSGIEPKDFGKEEVRGEARVVYDEKVRCFVASQDSWTSKHTTHTTVMKDDTYKYNVNAITCMQGSGGFMVTVPNPAIVSLLKSKIRELESARAASAGE